MFESPFSRRPVKSGFDHSVILIHHGWDWRYGAMPIGTVIFWTSLTLLDPLVAILLFLMPKPAAIMLMILMASARAGELLKIPFHEKAAIAINMNFKALCRKAGRTKPCSRVCTLGSVTFDILSIEDPSNLPEEIIAMLTATVGSRCRWRGTLITIAGGISILILLASIRVPAQTQSLKNAAVPQGWSLAGSNPTNYETGLDPQASYHGFPSAYLKARQSAMEGFGTLMQEFSAGQYAGKRVRLRASVKAEEVDDWAGLWMRIDKGSTAISFDNMRDRPIKGTTTWQDYEVILDVPQDATHIAFGILISKSGSVWLNGVKFESVGLDVPTTGKAPRRLPEGPTNLNFEN